MISVYGFKNKTLEAKPQNILLEVDKSLGILSLIRCWSSTKSMLSPPHTHLTLTLCLQFVTELNYVSPLRSLVTWQPSPVGTVSSPTTLTSPDWFFPPTRFLPISPTRYPLCSFRSCLVQVTLLPSFHKNIFL